MDKLNTKFWFSTMQETNENYDEYIEILLNRAVVPIKTLLGHSVISVNDFIGLQRGDIIKLDTKTDSELDVYVGNIKKFTALPGSSKDKYAVRVTSVVREGDE